MNYIDVSINGHRYTNNPALAESAGIPPEYQFIGYNAIHALANYAEDVVAVGSATVDAAQASQIAAAASAASAIVLPSTAASSITSLAVGAGVKNFVMELGKNFKKDMWVTLASSSSPSTIFMNGPLASYDPATGAASATITRAQGVGSFADWSITLSAPASPPTGGSVTGPGNLNVTATSLKYQEIQATGYGAAFNLSAASAGIQGPAAFTLRNRAATYPWDVQVKVGTLRGFVRANKSAFVDVIGSAYQPRDLSGYGGLVLKQVTFGGIVAGTAGLWTKAVRLPSGATLILVHGANLYAVLFDLVGDFSAPLLVRTGLSTAGADTTVAAVAVGDGTDNVLVASVPEGGTTMQSVVVEVTPSSTLNLGTMVPTTVAATGRIVELRRLADLSTGLPFILGLMNAAGTSLMTYGGSVTAPGALTHALNAVRSDTTVGNVGALLVDDSVPNFYMTVTASATTTLAIKAFSVSGAGVQTAGASATRTITAATAVLVRPLFQGANGATETGPWAIGYVASNVVNVAKLTLVGAVPTLGAGAPVNSAITTVASFSLGETLNAAYQGAAACGTDASGRNLVEMVDFSMNFDPPAPITALTAIAMSGAITAVWIGPGTGNGGSGAYVGLWQITAGSEAMVAMTQVTGAGLPSAFRMLNAAGYATLLQAPDALTIKTSRNRNTLRSATRCIALGDGSKPSMEYVFESASGEPSARPIAPVAALTYGSFSGEAFPDSTWLAAGAAPMASLLIQNFKVA
jgi:hypothetical protein